MTNDKQIEIYQGHDGQTEIEVRLEAETVWLTQSQMAELYGRDQSVVSRHIRNALKEGELAEQSNMQKMHIANSDRPVTFYHLDVVISVGYRIKSSQGVQFRRRATQRLKEYLVRGYTYDRTRFKKNADQADHEHAERPGPNWMTGPDPGGISSTWWWILHHQVARAYPLLRPVPFGSDEGFASTHWPSAQPYPDTAQPV